MDSKHVATPLTEADAQYWDATASSLRLEAKRTRNYESKQTHERDAIDADRHAAAIRARIAETTIDQLMEQAQVFASAWSLVGGKFDSGDGIAHAETMKAELRAMLVAAIASAEKQTN